MRNKIRNFNVLMMLLLILFVALARIYTGAITWKAKEMIATAEEADIARNEAVAKDMFIPKDKISDKNEVLAVQILFALALSSVTSLIS